MRFVRPTALGAGVLFLAAWVGWLALGPEDEGSIFDGAEFWLVRSEAREPVPHLRAVEQAVGFRVPDPPDLPVDLQVHSVEAHLRLGLVRLVLAPLRDAPPITLDMRREPFEVPRAPAPEEFEFQGVAVAQHVGRGVLEIDHPLTPSVVGAYQVAWWEACDLSFVAIRDSTDGLRIAQAFNLAPLMADSC